MFLKIYNSAYNFIMNLRFPKLADVDKLYEIELENFGEDEPTPKDTFRDIVVTPLKFIDYRFIVLADENVLGFYCTVKNGSNIELLDIAVAKKFQGNGFGRILLEDCVSFYKDSPILLKVREDNSSAIALYKKTRFTQIEILENYYGAVNCLMFKK